jgi:pimeloyl-ACP methyl ester carboxylesterase
MPAPFRRALTELRTDTELTIENILDHLGITRALEGSPETSNSSGELIQQVAALQRSAKFSTVTTNELRAFAQSARQVRAAGNLGDRPLIVLTAGKAEPAIDLPEGTTPADLAKWRRIWVDELQINEMHLSTSGQRVVVADSGHMIPFERPDAIVTAIREVCEAARDRSHDTTELPAASQEHD